MIGAENGMLLYMLYCIAYTYNLYDIRIKDHVENSGDNNSFEVEWMPRHAYQATISNNEFSH